MARGQAYHQLEIILLAPLKTGICCAAMLMIGISGKQTSGSASCNEPFADDSHLGKHLLVDYCLFSQLCQLGRNGIPF
jgi:hypothetical protein